MENEAPTVKSKGGIKVDAFTDRISYAEWLTGEAVQEVTVEEIYEIVKGIKDPEYPLTLEELAVVSRQSIQPIGRDHYQLQFTPTVPHCSQATMIGLSIRVILDRCLPKRVKMLVAVTPHTHNSDQSISKQISDKERVAAAMENPSVSKLITKSLEGYRSVHDVVLSSLNLPHVSSKLEEPFSLTKMTEHILF